MYLSPWKPVHCTLRIEILPTLHLQNQVPGACWEEKYKVLLSQGAPSNWIQAGKVINVYAQMCFPNEKSEYSSSKGPKKVFFPPVYESAKTRHRGIVSIVLVIIWVDYNYNTKPSASWGVPHYCVSKSD